MPASWGSQHHACLHPSSCSISGTEYAQAKPRPLQSTLRMPPTCLAVQSTCFASDILTIDTPRIRGVMLCTRPKKALAITASASMETGTWVVNTRTRPVLSKNISRSSSAASLSNGNTQVVSARRGATPRCRRGGGPTPRDPRLDSEPAPECNRQAASLSISG